jgi:hypothetical protein
MDPNPRHTEQILDPDPGKLYKSLWIRIRNTAWDAVQQKYS